MKLVTTIEIQLSPEETKAWNILFETMSKAFHSQLFRSPCEDSDTVEAINNFYLAMLNFSEYLAD